MKSILVLSAMIFTILACTSSSVELKPTHNDGRYSIQVFNRDSTKDIILSGYVRGLEEENPLVLGAVRWGCSQVQVDQVTGFYLIREKGPISSTEFLECFTLGYRELETEHFLVNRGDSIVIDFFLAYDDRPIIHCDPSFLIQDSIK